MPIRTRGVARFWSAVRLPRTRRLLPAILPLEHRVKQFGVLVLASEPVDPQLEWSDSEAKEANGGKPIMALDVYVIPIWRFKAGDFRSPLNDIGLSPLIVGPDGVQRPEDTCGPGFVSGWKARRATRQLRREIETEIGHAVRWNEEGEVAYAEQGHGFQALRAFAKWLDYRDLFPTFELPPDGNYYDHPVMSDELARPLMYPQVVEHCCHSGYYVPAELERVVYVEPFQSWGGLTFKRSVGSSPRLLTELQQLVERLDSANHFIPAHSPRSSRPARFPAFHERADDRPAMRVRPTGRPP